jgi:hypothetical protein
MIIQARFGSTQTGLGYQFFDSAGALLGSRVTSGISALPETGSYVATATVPAGAVGVYWSSATSEASEDLREALGIAALPADTAIAAAVRTNLATELGRIDVAVSTRNATAPPSAADIADAVVDENLATGTPGTQTLRGIFAPATVEAPVVAPAPPSDGSLSTVYIYTETITNQKTAGIALKFTLASPPSKSERVLETAEQTATTDADGFASITLQRNVAYLVDCAALGLRKPFTPTAATYNLLTLVP